MNMKSLYAVLSVLGIVLPFSQFVPWVVDNGFDISMLLSEATSTRIGAFAWLDVAVSAVVLIGIILVEGRRLKMHRLWLPVLGTCTVGVSLGLPLFLFLRENHLNQEMSR